MAYLFQSGSMESQLSGGMDFNYSNVETDKMMAINSDAANQSAAAGTLGFGAEGAPNDGALYWDGSALCVAAGGAKTAHFDGDGLDLVTGDAYLINNVSMLNATTLGSTVVTTSATTVGALDAGSISANFGNIDNGTSTIQTGGKLVIDVDGSSINAAGALTLGAGSDASMYWDGGSLVLDTAAASDIAFEVAGTEVASLDGDGLSLAAGDAYQIDGASVLDATTLGSAVVNSSLTSLGTITSLVATNIDGIIGASTARAAQFTTISGSSTLIVDGASVFNSGITVKANQNIALGISGDTALDRAADGLYFADATDNYVKTVSIGSFCTDIAGSGLTVSSNQLTLESNVVYAWADANATLSGGVNYMTADLGADRTLTLPRCNTDFDAGDKVTLKLLQCDGFTATVAPNSNDQIDDLAVDVGIELQSDNAAITLVCVSAASAGKWRII